MYKHDRPTERENLLAVLNGQQPEWIPIVDSGLACLNRPDIESAYDTSFHSFLYAWDNGSRELEDIFGVKWAKALATQAPMPIPEYQVVPDITKWRETLPEFPNLKAMDWEQMAARDTAFWNREKHLTNVFYGGCVSGVLFNFLINFMGHEDTLMALLEEPEAFHEMAEYITDWGVELIHYTAKYYKPDMMTLADDLASKSNLFMAPDCYREMIKPYHKRMIDAIKEHGLYVGFHCCGNCETIIPDFVELGIQVWDSAQQWNDLKKIKQTYGNRFIFQGSWDAQGAPSQIGASEALVRKAVDDLMDMLAPGGGYIFSTCGMVHPDWLGMDHFGWIYDEANRYGKTFYQK